MKKRMYKKPTMKVVKLQHTGMLMTSGVESERSGYGEAQEEEWN